MGLVMYIGILADLDGEDPEIIEDTEKSVESIGRILQENGLPEHHEPRQYPADGEVEGYWNFCIHYGCVELLCEKIEELLDQGSLAISRETAAHLIHHSTVDGFWVPLDFQTFLAGGDGPDIGSSYRLKEICEAVAPHLQIPVPLDTIPYDESGEGDTITEYFEENGFEFEDDGIVQLLCIIMHQAARISIGNRMLLAFG